MAADHVIYPIDQNYTSSISLWTFCALVEASFQISWPDAFTQVDAHTYFCYETVCLRKCLCSDTPISLIFHFDNSEIKLFFFILPCAETRFFLIDFHLTVPAVKPNWYANQNHQIPPRTHSIVNLSIIVGRLFFLHVCDTYARAERSTSSLYETVGSAGTALPIYLRIMVSIHQ